MLGKSSNDVGRWVILSFSALMIASLAFMLGSLMLIASRADRISQQREVGLVVNAIESKLYGVVNRQRELIRRTTPENFPLTYGHERTFLVDSYGKVSPLDMSGGLRPWSPSGTRDALSPAVWMFNDPSRGQIEGAALGLNLAWMEGAPQLVIAARPASGAQILVDVIDLDQLRPSLAKRFNLSDMAFTQAGDAQAEPLRLVNQQGIPILSGIDLGLRWNKMIVGKTIIDNAAPLLLLAALLFLGGGAWLGLRMRRMARRLVASETHAKHLALHDPMTGLANRNLFTDRLEHAIQMRRRGGGHIAVVVIDLDRFKRVNDTLGHQAGDQLIREASRRIMAVCRSSDTIARIGGDEFALVLSPVEGIDGARTLCDRLSRSLTTVLDVEGGHAVLSASLGVTVVSDARIEGVDAIRQADLALYRAKADGRGCWRLFEPEMDEGYRLRQMVEADLRRAIESESLEVAYQAQFTAKGRIEGVEALVRWTHPDRGPISPAEFIPIAEEAGLVDDLGEFVLRRALADARRWPAIKVAINVSPIQLRRPSFVELCRSIAQETGVDPHRVELEITEGVLLENDVQVQETLHRLRELGFRLALDDFGTGYSSLSYLNLYPIDKIKIDRSFVSNLSLDGEADKVVRAIIHLGRVLGLSVTAEGVETEAQRMKLVAAGCNSLQGYLHGKPSSASVIDGLVAGKANARVA